MTHQTITISTAVAGVVFAASVWPTVYRYDHMKFASGTALPVRIHRITGTTEILFGSGWEVADDSGSKSAKFESVPADEIAKLQGTANVYSSELTCKIYNGSIWRIREIVVNLQVFDSDSHFPTLERDYRLSNKYFTDPLETGIFSDYVWFDLQRGQRIAWYIKDAKGEPQ